MRIITEPFLKAAAKKHPRAAEVIKAWAEVVKAEHWRNPVELKRSFPDIDPVKVKSGNTVYVCNLRRNEFRLIVAVHFNRQRVYMLRFFTHGEYAHLPWRNEL